MNVPRMSPGRYVKNSSLMFLFYLPVMYLAVILAVSLHEIAGHGLAALAMGGRFRGFGVYPDGMGWADIDIAGLSAPRMAFSLLSGGLVTSAAAVVFFLLGILPGRGPYARTAFLIFAFVAFMDGVPYFFWDAICLAGIGDFSMISMLYPGGFLRIAVIASCGLLLAGGITAFNVLLYGITCRLIGEGELTTPGRRIAPAAMLFVFQAAGWFIFDWNALVPGVGLLPGTTALLPTAAVLSFLVFRKGPASAPAENGLPTGTRSWKPVLAAWSACLIVAAVTVFWSGNGVSF